MSRKAKRDRSLSAEQRKIAEHGFTPEVVAHHAKAAGLKLNEEALADISRILNNWRWLAKTEKGHEESKRRRQKLAGALTALSEVGPLLRVELVQAMTYASDDADLTLNAVQNAMLRAQIKEGLDALDALGLGITLAARTRILLHPETRVRGMDSWGDYAGSIEDLITRVTAGAASKEAIYRFIEIIAPALTHERTSFQAVKTQLKRGRRPHRGWLPA